MTSEKSWTKNSNGMNQPALFDHQPLFFSLILLLMIVLITGGMGIYVMSDPGIAQAQTLARAAITIFERHGYDIAANELITSARQAIFDRLDRYSGYLTASELNRIDQELSGHYSGIGVTVLRHDLGLLIMSVRENGPAAEMGLLSGDIVVAADSVNLAGLSFDSAADLLHGDEGTEVLVRFFRPSAKDTLEVRITRRYIPFTHVVYAGYTPDSILYLRLLDFEAGASADVKAALDSLVIVRRFQPHGFILDLRGNPGGLLVEAYETADLFLEKGTFIVGTDARSRWNDNQYYADGKDVINGVPMAVVVDRGSASSAEIVAGALKQAGRAVLVGDTTFGKGLVQGLTKLPDGDGLRLTIARYYLADSLFLNLFDSALDDIGHGLAPDYYYSFVEKQPFLQMLESSMLLQEFADVYQNEIISAASDTAIEDIWTERLASYAQEQHFDYKSSVTKVSESLYQLTVEEGVSTEARSVVAAISQLASRDDKNQYHRYADYINLRLREIAFERKYGTYRAYRDVIVPHRPIIRFASSILLGKH
jgi:C-terminal peptidase prc